MKSRDFIQVQRTFSYMIILKFFSFLLLFSLQIITNYISDLSHYVGAITIGCSLKGTGTLKCDSICIKLLAKSIKRTLAHKNIPCETYGYIKV